jgi:hypothetical protein
MTSQEAKNWVAGYYLFRRFFPYVVTEYGGADIFALDGNMKSIEVEIKVNMGDLQTELRTIKHLLGIKIVAREKVKNLNKWLKHHDLLNGVGRRGPSRFYFAVPEPLIEKALKVLIHTPYGLIQIGEGFWQCFVKKRAKKLHDESVEIINAQSLFRKACTENYYLREKLLKK